MARVIAAPAPHDKQQKVDVQRVRDTLGGFTFALVGQTFLSVMAG
ncbi:MAG TPA: hypothetical protein VIL86_02965 [Tepidisphaeraceae bacterium]|jgi:hypothetical protein